jgi:hypothetical protein
MSQDFYKDLGNTLPYDALGNLSFERIDPMILFYLILPDSAVKNFFGGQFLTYRGLSLIISTVSYP